MIYLQERNKRSAYRLNHADSIADTFEVNAVSVYTDGISIEDHMLFYRESLELSENQRWYLILQVKVMDSNFLMIFHA